MRHALVRALLVHYLERVGYTGKVRVFTRKAHYERVCGQSRPTDGKTLYAESVHGRKAAVWVDVSKHKTISALADTCAHEAVHLALGPYFPHGNAFNARVRRLLRGGRL